MTEQSRTMLSFDITAGRFQFRVAGIALRDKHVLVHRALVDDFWSLPGGRVEHFELSATALMREMREELLVDVDIGPLAYAIESHFSITGYPYHEIGFYYGMDLPLSFPFSSGDICHRVRDGENDLEFKWVPARRDILDDLDFGPRVLRDKLDALPTSLRHIIDNEK